jgi:hypothetical protein
VKLSSVGAEPMSLEEGARGYQMFKHKTDGCLRAVFRASA